MKMYIKPAFRYQFSSFLKGAAMVYLILLFTVAALIVGTSFISIKTGTSSFTGYGITSAIFMFIMGILSIRGDLRLCLQFGISRRTTFVSELLVILSASIIIAAAGELLTGVAQALLKGNPRFFVADLYQIIYVGNDITPLPFGQHVMSALFNTSLTFCACLFGVFFSLMFWRLDKVWSVIAAISIPVLPYAISLLLSKFGVDLTPFIRWIASSPFCFVLFLLILAALFGIISWLLLKKVNIREAK